MSLQQATMRARALNFPTETVVPDTGIDLKRKLEPIAQPIPVVNQARISFIDELVVVESQIASLHLRREQLLDKMLAIPVTRPLMVEDIIRKVATMFDVDRDEIKSDRRHKAIILPRHVAMSLAKQLTKKSYPEIGKAFGGRDHTTILHACRKIDEARRTDEGLNAQIETLIGQIRPNIAA